MADFHLTPSLVPKTTQRPVLLGRVKMAQSLMLRESEWAKALAEVERDPLFQSLMMATAAGQRIISYHRMPQTSLSMRFYEEATVNVVDASGLSPETLLDRKQHLLTLIKEVGQKNFEDYFLYRESLLTIKEVADHCKISETQAKELQDFILEMSIQGEFYHPSNLLSAEKGRPILVGEIHPDGRGNFYVAFYSPHLARGRFDINLGAFKAWKKEKNVDRADAQKLRRFLGLLELSNLKQGAFMKTLSFILENQKAYLTSREKNDLVPVSLRKVAAAVQFAPSTLSRLLAKRSVLLPWGEEIFLTHLMPGQRKVIVSLLEKMMVSQRKKHPDQFYMKALLEKHGIRVSRRTVTACRHVIEAEARQKPT